MAGSIYALYDPRDHRVRYVGQTMLPLEQRRRLHVSGSRTKPQGRSAYCGHWIRKLLDEGVEPSIFELEHVMGDRSFLDAAEEEQIRQLRGGGHALTNHLPGGGGFKAKRSEATRARMRKPKSEAQRVNMRKAQKKRWEDPAAHERMRAALNRPETRRKLSEAAIKQHAEGRNRWAQTRR